MKRNSRIKKASDGDKAQVSLHARRQNSRIWLGPPHFCDIPEARGRGGGIAVGPRPSKRRGAGTPRARAPPGRHSAATRRFVGCRRQPQHRRYSTSGEDNDLRMQRGRRFQSDLFSHTAALDEYVWPVSRKKKVLLYQQNHLLTLEPSTCLFWHMTLFTVVLLKNTRFRASKISDLIINAKTLTHIIQSQKFWDPEI